MAGREEEFSERLVRIETKVDMLIESKNIQMKSEKKLEERIEDIERRLNLFGGALLVINFFVLFFSDAIKAIIAKA